MWGALTQSTAWAEVAWTDTTQNNDDITTTTKTVEVTTADGLTEGLNAIDNTKANTTWVIKMTGNIELTTTLNITKKVTLDLNGHVLSLAQDKTGSVIKVTNKCTLTIKDSNPNSTHK